MPLVTGTRLGPYEIVAPLGQGGMGEVYKARDTRLDRIVAIKVLPAHLASDPDFRERFEREARAVAALNHPHICTLYDIGNQDGVDFLVMEYLEGETLAEHLQAVASGLSRTRGAGSTGPGLLVKGSGLPVDETLMIAIQMADALAAAHRAGITHRDLKPGNIFLTKTARQGSPQAKLLDFGLAKTNSRAGPFGPAGAPGPKDPAYVPTALPTMPPTLTGQGTILGTFQYMAPEQLEGKDADARTDIFAFGAVVYEMLTGRKAFEGKSQASLIASILAVEPPAISTVQPLTPPVLDRIVKKCLAKEPDERWQSAKDLYDELRWSVEAGPQAAASTVAAPAARRGNRAAWMLAAVATVTTAAAIGLAIPYLRSAPSDVHPMRFSVFPPQNVTLTRSTNQTVAVVSPDGRRVAYVASRVGANPALWVRSLDALEAQPLPGTEGVGLVLPFWSPDSRTLGFFAGGKLKTIDAAGGPVQSLCDAPNGRGGAWNRDGVIVFAPNAVSGLFKVPAGGGQPTPVTTPDASRKEIAHRFPSFLPDGRHFLYFASPSNTIWLGSLDSKETTRLLQADSQAQYAAPGYVLFVRQGTLLAQPFDARRGTLTGDAVPIGEQLGPDANNYAPFSVSDSGVLAYRTGALNTTTQLTRFDRTGKALGPVGQPGLYRNPVLSRDGTRLAVEAVDPQGRNQDIWLVELARGVMSRFTFDPGNDIYPVWSPDGSRIMFGSDREGGAFNLYQKLANGAGVDEPVFKSGAMGAPYDWSPDGRYIVFRTRTEAGSFSQSILPLFGDQKPRPLLQSSMFTQTTGQVSPNGRWIAYISNESGRYEVYVQSFPTLRGGKWQISKDGAIHPRWRGDAKELFYYAADGRLMAVAIKSDTAVEVGTAVPLFEARMLNGPNTAVGFRQQYDVTRDGQRFLINVPLEDAAPSPITVVVNWTASLKK